MAHDYQTVSVACRSTLTSGIVAFHQGERKSQNEAHTSKFFFLVFFVGIIVKQVVYGKFMKQIRTVRHNFNTTGTANYRVQLAVPPSTNNNDNHNNIIVLKKLLNKYTKN